MQHAEFERCHRGLEDHADTVQNHSAMVSRCLRTWSLPPLSPPLAAPQDDAVTDNPETSAAEPVAMRRWLTAGDGIDNLHVARAPRPEPGPRQVLIRVEAVSLNYRDLLVINGESTWRPDRPVTPISDAAGTITAAGAEVTRFAVGDRVSPMFLPYWRTGPLTAEVYHSPTGGPVAPGVLADYIALDQDRIEAAPATLDIAQAATLPAAALTAWHAVALRCRVAAGDHVLVHGTGGVALFALQFAAALGARVAVTTSSAQKAARLTALGAAHVVDYRRNPDVAQQILEWTDGRGVEHVIETVGGANLNRSLRAVRIGGSIAFIGLLAGRSASINTYEFVTKNVDLHGIETGSAQMYRDMTRFIDDHHVTPIVDSTGAFTDIQPALHRLAAGAHFGKIVLLADHEPSH
ncbi:zinc-dependent alcohol dehydrogenase family protein [Dactylosporangium sp. CA-092794]|uniref:zinc-dependent alcohol dehydrogenase family protein n=1 Tax=Dactylosporangium sp. CA-092794 TaxID=3239929 RepID=UPI003D904261